jgi:hypothetical protein
MTSTFSIVGHMSREPRLAGKVAVISGASRGFGQAIAVRFVEEGARVVMLSRSNCDETLTLIGSIAGLDKPASDVAIHCTCDIGDEADIVRALGEAAEKFGDVMHVLVNNAACFIFHSVETATAADWDQSAAVNIKGHALLTKHMLPYMKRAGGGSIVWQVGAGCVRPQLDSIPFLSEASRLDSSRIQSCSLSGLYFLLSSATRLCDVLDHEGCDRAAREELCVRLREVPDQVQQRVRRHDRDPHQQGGACCTRLDV